MLPKTTLSLIALAFIGCSRYDAPRPDHSVYQAVLAHVSKLPPAGPKFIGTKVLILNGFCNGDSFFYSVDNGFIDEEREEALKTTNAKPGEFKESEFSLPTVKFEEAESFFKDVRESGYFKQDVDARCFVQFWQAGITKNGKRAVVRFYYGPSAHGAVGTYLLKLTSTGWQITASTISYYV